MPEGMRILRTTYEACPLGDGGRACEVRENVLGEAALRICEAVDEAVGDGGKGLG